MIAVHDLADRPHYMAALAALRTETFFADERRTVEEDKAGLTAIAAGDGSEIALIAEEDGQLLGGCLLVGRELEQHHDLSPWLAGLVVAPEARGLGVGTALVGAIEDAARSRGVPRLHLYADTAEGFYRALGWRVLERGVDRDGPFALMARDLTSAAASPLPGRARRPRDS